jgi:hypothetical protein
VSLLPAAGVLADGSGRRAGRFRLRASRPAHPPGHAGNPPAAAVRGAEHLSCYLLIGTHGPCVPAWLPLTAVARRAPLRYRCAGNRGWPASGGREHLIEHLMFSSGRP